MLGIFDSGIGGLTVVRELLRRAPNASFVYLGDTARTPYGNKSPEVIRKYAIEDAAFLIAQGATTIVVACNTASALAMDVLRTTYPDVTFFDVITPVIEAVASLPIKKVGVIGTRATMRSGVYAARLKDRNQKLEVDEVACPLLVPLVEEGWIRKPETTRIVRSYLAPLKQKQIDALILGCTHYPLLEPVIRSVMQKRVRIIDAPSALLDQLEREAPKLLVSSPFARQRYFFTDVSSHTDAIASRWLGRTIKGELASNE
jgi:glutamate racemase